MIDQKLEQILDEFNEIVGISMTVIENFKIKPYTKGFSRVSTGEKLTESHLLQCASLSKTVGTAFAIEYLSRKGINMDSSVNSVLRSIGATWLIEGSTGPDGAVYNPEAVTLAMLVNHTALGMHYVYGIPLTDRMPTPLELINGSAVRYGYQPLKLERHAGESFSYSGGGFVVMQYLLETMAGQPIEQLTRGFLDGTGAWDFHFRQSSLPSGHKPVAYGHLRPSEEVSPLAFPPIAAGAVCTPAALSRFLCSLAEEFNRGTNSVTGGVLSPETARLMLGEDSLKDLGSMDFMGAKIGLGVFVATAGKNRVMMHQAANDGFRGVYMLCFQGPDCGKGFVISVNGDNPGVLAQCELSRFLLGPVLKFSGIDFELFEQRPCQLDISGMKQETIVNKVSIGRLKSSQFMTEFVPRSNTSARTLALTVYAKPPN